jgi:hypothetical protein
MLPIPSENIWAIAGDIALCYLGFTSAVVVAAIAAFIVAGSATGILGAALYAAGIGLLISMLSVVLIDETSLG